MTNHSLERYEKLFIVLHCRQGQYKASYFISSEEKVSHGHTPKCGPQRSMQYIPQMRISPTLQSISMKYHHQIPKYDANTFTNIHKTTRTFGQFWHTSMNWGYCCTSGYSSNSQLMYNVTTMYKLCKIDSIITLLLNSTPHARTQKMHNIGTKTAVYSTTIHVTWLQMLLYNGIKFN